MALVRGAIVLALLSLTLQPTGAGAATYDVYSCTLPNGKPVGTQGWHAELTGKPGFSISNSCLSPPSSAPTGALRGDITQASDPGDQVAWIFTAPKYTAISDFTLYRTGHTAGNGAWAHDFWFSYGLRGPLDRDHYPEFCSRYAWCTDRGVGRQRPFDAANRLSVSGLQVQQLIAQLTCDSTTSGCPTPTDHGWLEVYSARIGLSDFYPPAFTREPNGSLISTTTPLQGIRSVTFSTSDVGGGIEKVGVAVDGVMRTQRAVFDPASPTCRRPFTAIVPCPHSLTSTFALDTSQISNGTHTVQASVIDAAGNETRSDPVTVTILNGSQPNGRGASRFVKLSAWLRSKRDKPRRSAVVPFGATRFAEGRLVDSKGSPISGAVLQASSRVRRPGARYKRTGTVTTGEDGRFAYRIARGPSRTIRFAYKAYTLDPAPVQTATLSLGVKAGIGLRLSPHRVTNGQKVRFKGRLKGGPARKGTRVTIDVLVPDARRRVPIGNVKADAKGRFRFAYRFRRTLVKARYRFQARLSPQPGYPYRGATSRRVSVVVAP
jgi:hypothetical protein